MKPNGAVSLRSCRGRHTQEEHRALHQQAGLALELVTVSVKVWREANPQGSRDAVQKGGALNSPLQKVSFYPDGGVFYGCKTTGINGTRAQVRAPWRRLV